MYKGRKTNGRECGFCWVEKNGEAYNLDGVNTDQRKLETNLKMTEDKQQLR